MPVTWAREADWLPVSVFVGVALVVLWCSRWALEPVYNSWPAAAVPRQRQRISFTRRWIPILTLLIAFGALATFVSTSVANFSGQTASGGNRFRAAADFGGGGGSCGVASVSTGTTIGSTLTISHTTAAGSDRLMVVGVSINNRDFETVTGVTYDGAAFTFSGQETNADDGRVEIWYLVAPATGTHDAVITFSADLTKSAVAGVITFTGVDQTTPLVAFAGNQATSAGPATVTVPSAVDDLVLAVFSGETVTSVAIDSPAAQQWNLSETVPAPEQFGAGATDAGASPNVTISFSLGSNDHWATGGVAIKCLVTPTPTPTPTPIPCQIAVGSASDGTTAGSTMTISHTTAAGSDRLMVVGVSINNDDFETVLGITYNGAAFTFVGQETNADDARVEIWYLVAPDTGTHNAVITFNADLTRFAVAGVITFTGVDQATPLGTFASNQATSAGPATVTVPAASGDLVLGVFSGETFDSVAVDPPADEQWNLSEPVGASFEEFGAGATDAGASPNVTISFSLGSNDHWATGGVALKCP